MDRKIYDPQPPHDSAVLRTPLHEREPSAAAKRFLLPERDTYVGYIEPSDELAKSCELFDAQRQYERAREAIARLKARQLEEFGEGA